MSELNQLLVRRIKEGTVIDHITSGKAFNVLKTLNITGSDGNIVTVALNVPSTKKDKKDIIKVENKFLENLLWSIDLQVPGIEKDKKEEN